MMGCVNTGGPRISLAALAIALFSVGCASSSGGGVRDRAYGPVASQVSEIREGQQPELWGGLSRLIHDEYRLTQGFAEVNAAACLNDADGANCGRWRAFAGALAGLAHRAPRDGYIQTQAVFALVRGGDYDLAIIVAQDCQAVKWVCRVLEGFVYAESGQVVDAEAAFDDALPGMPESDLCAWTDLSPLLSRDVWTTIERSSCIDRLGRLDELWDLVDPSWAVPGNDRKVEHYDRVMWAMLRHSGATWLCGAVGCRPYGERGRTGYGYFGNREHWAEALGYGLHYYYFGSRWGRECRIDEYRGEWGGCPYTPDGQAYRVIPGDRALLDPLASSADDWPLEPTYIRGGRGAYIPRVGALFSMNAQVAFFERGDSLIAAAATTVPEAAGFGEDLLQGAFLFLHTDARTARIRAAGTARIGGWVFRATAPRRRYVVGIEAVAANAVGRARFGHGLPEDGDASLRLSDLLLYLSDGSSAPDSLEAALALMKGDDSWSRSETLGVFLEIYGPDDATTLPVSVELERADGWLARLGASLGFGGAKPINVQWSHRSAGGRFALSFTLDLREIPAGDYTVRVSVGDPQRNRAMVVKEIHVSDGS
jgi:hypothetical protein